MHIWTPRKPNQARRNFSSNFANAIAERQGISLTASTFYQQNKKTKISNKENQIHRRHLRQPIHKEHTERQRIPSTQTR